MKRRDFIKLSAGLGATMATATPLSSALAQTKMVLKASDVHPLGYPTVEAVVRMGKKLEAATNGRLTIQMFPSMQLGGEKEMIEQAQLGALQIARISVGAVGPVVDDVNVFNMPFVFRNSKHMEKVIDGEIGDELLAKISANEKTGLIALCWMNAGSRNVYNNKRPIRTIADLKGLKVRMMGNPLFVDTMNALGGNGVALGFDQDGREDQGNAGGGRHHVAKQAQRLGRTDCGDFPHVPNDRALGVEIGRHHEQFSALGIFACNGGQDLRPDIAGHQFAQSLIAEQAGSEEHADDAGIIEQARSYAAGVDLPQRVVVLGPEKRKRRNQAAGAHA